MYDIVLGCSFVAPPQVDRNHSSGGTSSSLLARSTLFLPISLLLILGYDVDILLVLLCTQQLLLLGTSLLFLNHQCHLPESCLFLCFILLYLNRRYLSPGSCFCCAPLSFISILSIITHLNLASLVHSIPFTLTISHSPRLSLFFLPSPLTLTGTPRVHISGVIE